MFEIMKVFQLTSEDELRGCLGLLLLVAGDTLVLALVLQADPSDGEAPRPGADPRTRHQDLPVLQPVDVDDGEARHGAVEGGGPPAVGDLLGREHVDREAGGDLQDVLHHVLVDLVVDPADVSARVSAGGPDDAEDGVAGGERGAGGDDLLAARDGVDLVPGVVRQRRPPGYAGQVHGAALLDPVDPADSVRLAETVGGSLRDYQVSRLQRGGSVLNS